MKIFKIKTTAAELNPQQIRVVKIDSEKSVRDFLKLVNIIYEYEDIKSSLSDESGNTKPEEMRLEDVFHADDFLTVRYKDKDMPSIFIEVLEESEQSEESEKTNEVVPILERYRTVPRRERERNFYYSVYNRETVEDFRMYLNKKIRRAFTASIEIPEFEWTIARPWGSLLDECTVTELKSIVRNNGLMISGNLRKNILKNEIIALAANDEFYAGIIQKMGISEYFNLRKLCTTGVDNGDAEKSFPVLSSNFLVEKDYWYVTMLASEFMRFFENWIENGNEKKYLQSHAEETCLMAACHLYGFADKLLIAELLKVLSPEYGQTEKVADIWKKVLKCGALEDIKYLDKYEIYYDSDCLNDSSAKSLYNGFISSKRTHYIPTREEIIEIAAYGIKMPKEDQLKLQEIMDRKYQIMRGSSEFVIKNIETAIRNGYSNEDITTYLRKLFMSGRRAPDLSEIVYILERAQQKVRKISLGGYTQEEFNDARVKRSKPT